MATTVQPQSAIFFSEDEQEPFDQWHRCIFDESQEDDDDEPWDCVEYYGFKDEDDNIIIGWCMGSVGQMTYLRFDTLENAEEWLLAEGADWVGN